MRKNIILDKDGYKLSHWKCMPDDLEGAYSYGESRLGLGDDSTLVCGLTIPIHEHLLEPITQEMIDEAKLETDSCFGPFNVFNEEVWKKVMKLGYLPLEIKAVPEGTLLPRGNAKFTVEATEKWFAPEAQSIESFLMHQYYPTNVSTRAFYIKRSILPYFKNTSDNLDLLPYAVIDFGVRGATSFESAAIAGFGHMIHFPGSDNIPATRAVIKDIYGYQGRLKSVVASEHFVALAFGPNNELEYVKHMLTKAVRLDQPVSIVIDAFDQDNFVKNVICHPEIIEIVKQRTGRTIWRPDTGNCLINIPKYLDIVGATYGWSINSKDYKVLKENQGFLQGDGMNRQSIPELYKTVTECGWSADNVNTGSGGGLLQEGISRDQYRDAIKPSQIIRAGQIIDVQKTPKSDPSKSSKKGRLKVHPTSRTSFITLESSKETPQSFNSFVDILEPVYINGEIIRPNFENIIKTAEKYL